MALLSDLWRKFLGVPELAKPPEFEEEEPSGYAEDEEEFIYFGSTRLTPWSSNVFSMKYVMKREKMIVGYVGWSGKRDESKLRYYIYSSITEMEARVLYRCNSSKGYSAGAQIWDDLRIRGTMCGHSKPYHFVSGFAPKKPC